MYDCNDMSDVGQDKKYQQPTDKYDADQGKYKQQEIALNGKAPAPAHSTPFKLNG